MLIREYTDTKDQGKIAVVYDETLPLKDTTIVHATSEYPLNRGLNVPGIIKEKLNNEEYTYAIPPKDWLF